MTKAWGVAVGEAPRQCFPFILCEHWQDADGEGLYMSIYNLDDAVEVLYDIKTATGKEIDWRKHRLITLRLATSYRRLNSHKYKRIIDCAGYMEFRRYTDHSMKLHTANFCQTRLCPTCNWRRSKRIFGQISRIMGHIENDYEFVFLTLTVKNCSGENLKSEIDKMVAAFKRLCLRKKIMDAVKGWCKVFEVTYNWATAEFHPHYHCILAVDKSYFTSDLYISQNELCSLWRQCLRVDYMPIVDIRAFSASEKGAGKEVAEVAKYTVKASNIMANLSGLSLYNQDIKDNVMSLTDSITDSIVLTLDNALTSRRLIEFGGIFKQTHRALRLDDDIDDDLIHAGDGNGQGGGGYQIERYGWIPNHRQYLRIDG